MKVALSTKQAPFHSNPILIPHKKARENKLGVIETEKDSEIKHRLPSFSASLYWACLNVSNDSNEFWTLNSTQNLVALGPKLLRAPLKVDPFTTCHMVASSTQVLLRFPSVASDIKDITSFLGFKSSTRISYEWHPNL